MIEEENNKKRRLLPAKEFLAKDGSRAINKKRQDRFKWRDDDFVLVPNKTKFIVKEDSVGTELNKAHRISPKEVEHHEKHFHSLKPEHHDSIKEYKASGHSPINSHLRHRGQSHADEEYAKKHIAHLDHVTNHPLSHAKTVYRGFGKDSNIHKHPEGTLLKDKGYTSTSHQPGMTKGFASHHVEKTEDGHTHHHHYIAKIHLPKGTKAHHLDTKSATHRFKDESEVLLHRGTTFNVGHTTTNSSHFEKDKLHHHWHTVHMTVHDQEDHH
jgi:hypothetical protein